MIYLCNAHDQSKCLSRRGKFGHDSSFINCNVLAQTFQTTDEGLVSKETVESRRSGSETLKFGVKQADKGQPHFHREEITELAF